MIEPKAKQVIDAIEFEAEIKIRQSAIDLLYQDILIKVKDFPAEIRRIFHEHMNRLTEAKNKAHVTEKE